jgi:hypothetical protein
LSFLLLVGEITQFQSTNHVARLLEIGCKPFSLTVSNMTHSFTDEPLAAVYFGLGAMVQPMREITGKAASLIIRPDQTFAGLRASRQGEQGDLKGTHFRRHWRRLTWNLTIRCTRNVCQIFMEGISAVQHEVTSVYCFRGAKWHSTAGIQNGG